MVWVCKGVLYKTTGSTMSCGLIWVHAFKLWVSTYQVQFLLWRLLLPLDVSSPVHRHLSLPFVGRLPENHKICIQYLQYLHFHFDCLDSNTIWFLLHIVIYIIKEKLYLHKLSHYDLKVKKNIQFITITQIEYRQLKLYETL